MISVVAFHFLAGAVTGSIFAVRTLLTLLALVLMGGCSSLSPRLSLDHSIDVLHRTGKQGLERCALGRLSGHRERSG